MIISLSRHPKSFFINQAVIVGMSQKPTPTGSHGKNRCRAHFPFRWVWQSASWKWRLVQTSGCAHATCIAKGWVLHEKEGFQLQCTFWDCFRHHCYCHIVGLYDTLGSRALLLFVQSSNIWIAESFMVVVGLDSADDCEEPWVCWRSR